MVAALVIDLTPVTEAKAGVVLVWTLAVAPFAYLGVRVLRMPDDEWAAPSDTRVPAAGESSRTVVLERP